MQEAENWDRITATMARFLSPCNWEVAMDLIRILLSRGAALFRRNRLDEDLEEELRSHFDFAIEENLKRGLSKEKARTIALRKFGGVTQTMER